MGNVDVSAPELEMLVEAEGIFGVLAALVDYVREECAMPTSWREHLRMKSEFVLISGQNLGACSRDRINVKGVWAWVVY
ncbi:hypothetical protein M405DRAFT_823746, partial [Rhizopogon salebrosus TDB-379]